jgi:hypothetical protein
MDEVRIDAARRAYDLDRRMISVHMLCLDDCFVTTMMPQPVEITQFVSVSL